MVGALFSVLFSFAGSAECPTLPQLMCFSIAGSPVDIIETISTKYRKFGTFLLQDDNGGKMKEIIKECREDTYDINQEVLRRWLNGEGKKPVSWATLATELERTGLSELAREIQNEL